MIQFVKRNKIGVNDVKISYSVLVVFHLIQQN